MQDKLLVKEGYSKDEIYNMETDEYDYLVQLTLKEKIKRAGNAPFEGI